MNNLVELCSRIFWKVELVNCEIGYFSKDVSDQNVEGMVPVCLSVYNKMWEEREKLKKELSKKKPEFKDLENPQVFHIAKKKKREKENPLCSKVNTKGMAGLSFDKEITGLFK